MLAAEGPRVPAYPDAPSAFSLSFLLIKRPGESLCDAELEALDEIIDRSLKQWVEQTRGRASLINRTHVDDPLDPGPACGDEPGTGGDDSSGDDSSNSSEGATPTTGGADPGPDPGSTGPDPDTSADTSGQSDDKGCGCRQSSPAAPWLLGLGLLPALRRRRRSSSHLA